MQIDDNDVEGLTITIEFHAKRLKAELEASLPHLKKDCDHWLAEVTDLSARLNSAMVNLDTSRGSLDDTMAALAKLNQLPEMLKVLTDKP